MPGPRGLSSRVSVTSHGSGGGFSVKDGAGGSHKTWKASVAGSTLFSHSLINLTQVMFPYVFFVDLTFALIAARLENMQLWVNLCVKMVDTDIDIL